MKTIGLLGGMSWESTVGYYCAINKGIKAALGELHSAKIAMVSVDFDPIAKLQHEGDWEETGRLLAEAAKSIQAAGADFLLICANTMHGVIRQRGIKTVGLLGTAFTMEQSFIKGRLEEKHGIHVIVPNEEDRKTVHDVIYDELCLGKQLDASKAKYLRIIDTLVDEGAEAVILGCTEIGMLVSQSDTQVMLLDTTVIHADKAVEEALR